MEEKSVELLTELNKKMDKLNSNMEKLLLVLANKKHFDNQQDVNLPGFDIPTLDTGGDTATLVREKIKKAREEAERKIKSLANI